MRKKTSQVTTLHVIHHGCMPMSVWFGVKFTPGNVKKIKIFIFSFYSVYLSGFFFISLIRFVEY